MRDTLHILACPVTHNLVAMPISHLATVVQVGPKAN